MAIILKKDNQEEEEERILPFSYDSITDRDKQVVEEVMAELQLGDSIQSEKLKEKFDITPTTTVPNDKCIFYNITKQLGLYVTPQGFVREGLIKYPIFSLTGDCRELDNLVMAIVKKYDKSNTKI